MNKIDPEVLEALAQAVKTSVQELKNSANTDKENICWVKMNFIKHFTEDIFFLNDHSEDVSFHQRYGNLIIRDMLEQLIEFLYILKNPNRAKEYLGLTINLEELNRKQSLVNKEKSLGAKRYNKESNDRPFVSKMAEDIGEKHSIDGNITLYNLYQILSEQCHNAYFSSLLGDINRVNLSISTSGLSKGQLRDILIMSLIVLRNFNISLESDKCYQP